MQLSILVPTMELLHKQRPIGKYLLGRFGFVMFSQESFSF